MYQEIKIFGDPLTGISDCMGLERIWTIMSDQFTNYTEKGGRPKYDPSMILLL